MFTRAVELTSKPGKSKELSNAINEKALPILQKQSGFVDEILLVSNTEPERVLALSFCQTRDDAERINANNTRASLTPFGTFLALSP